MAPSPPGGQDIFTCYDGDLGDDAAHPLPGTEGAADPGSADRPDWSPDGRRVAYLATVNGVRSAYLRRADGSDSERPAGPSP